MKIIFNIILNRLIITSTTYTKITNIKNNNEMTALIEAVNYGRVELVKEIRKVEGTDFDTKDSDGRTLIEVSRMRNNIEMLEYLLNRKKNTLKGLAANSVAKIVQNKEDVDALCIPQVLKPLVSEFVDN